MGTSFRCALGMVCQRGTIASMCAIACIAGPGAQVHAPALADMIRVMKHRGPDGDGARTFEGCALGNARLSIVDRDGGGQPMLSPDGRVGLTFNGEIYGYKKIRSDLRGYPFRTHADTEVILALYERHRAAFVAHLPGMFGLALWDDRAKELFCARDRFGEKPVYYAFGRSGELVVASEIKGVLASGLVAPVLSLEGISHYLQHGHVHPARTIYSNVHVLPPAHMLRFREGRVTVRRYWDYPAVLPHLELSEAVERFRDLFEGAVRKQLVADVPVGVFLSGGTDSSTVAAVASLFQPDLKTFSFGFREGVESELPYARQTAALHGTRHFERLDEPGAVAELLWRMQDVYDEPLGDSSNIPTFLLCELAREHVRVVLGGDGADELLGGYIPWARHLIPPGAAAPARARRGVEIALRRLARRVRSRLRGRDVPTASGNELVHLYYRGFRRCFTAVERVELGVPLDTENLVDFDRYPSGGIGDLMRFDTDHYLPGDVLVKTDRASMANSLELRSPFLDLDVASFLLSVPDRLKADGVHDKRLLREAYRQSWTHEVRSRKKQGFGGPVREWLRLPAVEELKKAYLGDPAQRVFEVIDFGACRRVLPQDDQQTWVLLVLALWMARHSFALP